MSHWQLGKGDISFWHFNWCGEVLNPEMNVDCTMKEGIQQLDQWDHILLDDQRYTITLVELNPNEKDNLILSISATGSFSIAKYLAVNRVGFSKVVWNRYVWNCFTPYRANTFNWRVFQNALPVDQNVQHKGIPLASMCVCCATPKIETCEHLFIHSDLARGVRSFFAAKVNKKVHVHSIEHFIASWMHGVSLQQVAPNLC